MQVLDKPKQPNSQSSAAEKTKHYQNFRIRTPTLLQMEAVECGAASLGIMLGYYGRIVPLPELRSSCGVSRDGSKASNVLKAARTYGLQAKGFKKETTQLLEIKPPYIIFWNFNHFLVVEGFVGDRVYLNDPAAGPRSVTLQEFDEAYTGVVLVMEPGPEFKKGGHKPSIIRALAARLKGSRKELLFCILIGFLLVLPNLAIAAFSQIFVDNVLVENRNDWLRPLVLGLILTMLLQGTLKLLQLRKLRYLHMRLSVSMTGKFLWHVLHLPVSFYAQRFAGEISNRVRINSDVAKVLSGDLAKAAIDAVMIIFYGGVMLAYDPVLTLIGIVAVSINIFVLQSISRQRVDTHMRLTQDYGKLAGVEIGGLMSIETLKSAALESDFFSRWAGYFAKTTNAEQELGVSDLILGQLPSLLSSLTTAALLIIGGLRVMDGHLSIGMLVAFQALMGDFQEPVNTLVSLGSKLQSLNGDLNRLDDVLSNPVDPALKPGESTAQPPILQLATAPNYHRLQGAIELRNVTFGYSRVEEPLIKDFSCRLAPGQRIAFVGGSGSGKSTLSKLITGLYEPWEGEILFDGVPRKQIPRSILANSLAMVEQEIFLFGGTVRENLSLWDDTLSDAQLMKACADAAILEVVMAIPGGLNGTLAESGANLSGGQRQRLEIARALVNDPAILVMDEATSALDAETEKIIDRNIRRRGCTCVIVAHRLSTIRDCDEIVVLDRGKVVQRGTHEEMKGIEGAYARLINAE
ncbi:NHLP family bacteriocin export ABC transporter peptidase/permease/ATPase subunit [Leptothermofonsia sichuanensis E412]|uniref:NHLP family bacteriocin export ABC transporter peptidase/permease/ATPase subunit n=1 Tax=Leptothermofonsia sichuanensis TaxID=2917832 RepID=UPI001CA62808|nr:NHLP family bacteriocin export ABC transporter peptidase/permease/ATPase subunit [Leptothermofonsia sichuanensis]QZZ18763.1 NHLP family bacteriocin export ABC transporter peptidase/permease/ATPase subunit [Leptothermofonsia sichuanensis E412]